jgi:uncharacterized membrane protein YeaQ/YmgE (transglycosylase-associated protein family)
MDVLTFVIGALVTGIIIGALARLVIPGRQPIGILRTILAGFVGAVIGGLIVYAVDKNAEDHEVVVFAVQVACAAVIVWFLAGRTRRADVG